MVRFNRLVQPFTTVVKEVRKDLAKNHNITSADLKMFRQRVINNGHDFPTGSHFVKLKDLHIDYEVQRAAIVEHILKIIRNFDPRLCSPASACQVEGENYITVYDGQQHSIAMALLGYTEVPAIVVTTKDPAFPSYAFETLNDTGIKKLTHFDKHRTRLTRYRLGNRDVQHVMSRTMQDQFDEVGIDFEDKATRKNPDRRGDNDYFFSHYKYAEKVMKHDPTGSLLREILETMVSEFPDQEEIDQGVFIGLYELSRLDFLKNLSAGWMTDVLNSARKFFNTSHLVHKKAKIQWDYIKPGSTWSAPSAMSNFLREIHILDSGKHKDILPYHGLGALMEIDTNPAPEVFLPMAA